MPDILISQAEFEALKSLAEKGRAVQTKLLRIAQLPRPLTHYDIEGPEFSAFYTALDSTEDIQARPVEKAASNGGSHANKSRTQPAKK